MNLSKLWERVEDREAWHATVSEVTKVGYDLATEQQQAEYEILSYQLSIVSYYIKQTSGARKLQFLCPFVFRPTLFYKPISRV